MLVVPKAIGAKSLFIDKKHLIFNVGDFGNPSNPKEWVNGNFILDDLPCKHLMTFASVENFKVQLGWGDDSQVIGRAKKLPGLLERGRYPCSLC